MAPGCIGAPHSDSTCPRRGEAWDLAARTLALTGFPVPDVIVHPQPAILIQSVPLILGPEAAHPSDLGAGYLLGQGQGTTWPFLSIVCLTQCLWPEDGAWPSTGWVPFPHVLIQIPATLSQPPSLT